MRYRPLTHTQKIVSEYGIEVFYTTTPQCSAIGYRGKSSKHSFFYRFKDDENMMQYINKFIDSVIKSENEKRERKSIAKGFMESMKASDNFSVGDIVVNTWGWEQTNVEFYQVVEVLNKKIRVNEVYQTLIPDEGLSSMAGYVMPRIDNFINSEKSFLLSLKVDEKNRVRICNPKSFYYFKKWDGKKEYNSWYA
jgi:hypothetical protein